MGYHASSDYSEDPALASFPLTTRRSRVTRKNHELAESESLSAAHLGKALAAKVPASWPPVQQPTRPGSEELSWTNYYYIFVENGQEPVLAGSMGLAMWPGAGRVVEFGGSLLPEFQGFGIAADTCALVEDWARAHPQIDRIICDVAADNKLMAKCLERAGYSKEGEEPSTGFVRFFKWVDGRP
jgi:RimJ/RimL family protein N-acetyltransferase